MYTILGAGLSGLSVADHLKSKNIAFEVFEAKAHGGGHIYSEKVQGFTWDEGPHVSFTKHSYVKNYLAKNCGQHFLEFEAVPSNYYRGNWIMHPAQSNLYAVPEPLRTECVRDVKAVRESLPENYVPEDYQQWIDYAFGKRFAEVFPKIYTDKYWTTCPENLTTDWIGKRIYFPEVADMINSCEGPLAKSTHYVADIRYPKAGGFYSFIQNVETALPITYNKKLSNISFEHKQLKFEDGSSSVYDKLINTLPLPQLIAISDAPERIKKSAQELNCSQLLLINVIVNHRPAVQNHWIYVYDDDFYSTRINFTDLLSPQNGISGQCGIQVEVYFSAYRPVDKPVELIAKQVIKELVSMKLIQVEEDVMHYHTKWIDWANVIFDKKRRKAQNEVLHWLESIGMRREADELEPMTDWETKMPLALGGIIMAGRFAQWKYYWTDDCIMRAKYISENIS